MPGKIEGSQKQSLADRARAQVERLCSIKEKWIRGWTWQQFTFGMVASQRGENAFRWFKEAQTQKKHWPLSVVIKMAFAMSQDRGDKAEEQFFKGKAAAQRRRVSTGKQHRMFANVRGGEVTEYAFEKASCDAAIVLSTAYSVELTLTEEVTEDLTVLTFNVCVAVSKTVQCLTQNPDNSQEPAVYNDAEDYCGGGGTVHVVCVSYCLRTRTWTAKCTCFEDISRGWQCRHETAVAIKATGKFADYCVSIAMFNPIFQCVAAADYATASGAPTITPAADAASKTRPQPSAERMMFCSHMN